MEARLEELKMLARVKNREEVEKYIEKNQKNFGKLPPDPEVNVGQKRTHSQTINEASPKLRPQKVINKGATYRIEIPPPQVQPKVVPAEQMKSEQDFIEKIQKIDEIG